MKVEVKKIEFLLHTALVILVVLCSIYLLFSSYENRDVHPSSQGFADILNVLIIIIHFLVFIQIYGFVNLIIQNKKFKLFPYIYLLFILIFCCFLIPYQILIYGIIISLFLFVVIYLFKLINVKMFFIANAIFIIILSLLNALGI